MMTLRSKNITQQAKKSTGFMWIYLNIFHKIVQSFITVLYRPFVCLLYFENLLETVPSSTVYICVRVFVAFLFHLSANVLV